MDKQIIAQAAEVISELMDIIEWLDAPYYSGSNQITRADDLLKLIDGQIDADEYEKLTGEQLQK